MNPSPFLFGFLLFLNIFVHVFQEAISALRVLNMLDRHIDSLGKSLAPNLFVYNDANMMPLVPGLGSPLRNIFIL